MLPIGERKFGTLYVCMQILQTIMTHRGQVVALQKVQMLEENRPLTPSIALVDIITPVI